MGVSNESEEGGGFVFITEDDAAKWGIPPHVAEEVNRTATTASNMILNMTTEMASLVPTVLSVTFVSAVLARCAFEHSVFKRAFEKVGAGDGEGVSTSGPLFAIAMAESYHELSEDSDFKSQFIPPSMRDLELFKVMVAASDETAH